MAPGPNHIPALAAYRYSLTQCFWMLISQAASGAKRKYVSGIRLPALVKSDEA